MGRVTQYVEMLQDLCNRDFVLMDEVAATVPGWHRSLQSMMFKFCIKVLKALAAQERYDGRNERAVQLARKLVQVYEQEVELKW